MWHEARKQERKIRGMLVDYRRRAERRQDFYEKIKADPTQFMQIHGRKCKIHLDPAIAQLGDGAAIIVPWQGQKDNLIDRFDVRAHLDYIPPILKTTDLEEVSAEERQCNYERYRILAQNDFLCLTEDKYLHQLYLEEQFGVNAQVENEQQRTTINKKPSNSGAAIGYTYEDSEPSAPFSHILNANAVNISSVPIDDEEETDSDIDMDVSIEINKLDNSQAHDLNTCGRNYGMMSNDFYSFLVKDADEADAIRMAREEEQEKIMLSGRKSRRERRAQRERRCAGRPLSPPSYAAKEEPVENQNDNESDSRSPSPENSGKITYITSFGGEDELQPHSKISININKPQKGFGNSIGQHGIDGGMTYADKVKANLEKLKQMNESNRNYRKRDSHSPKKPKQYLRSRSRSRSRSRYRRHRSRSYSRNRSRSRSRSGRGGRGYKDRRSGRRRSPNSRSNSRTRSSYRRRNYSRSRTPHKTSQFHYRKRRSTSSSTSSSVDRRKRDRSRIMPIKKRSQSPIYRKSRSKSITKISNISFGTGESIIPNQISNPIGLSDTVSSLQQQSFKIITVQKTLTPPPQIPPVPIKRYYGRKRDNESSSSSSSDGDTEEDKPHMEINDNSNSNNFSPGTTANLNPSTIAAITSGSGSNSVIYGSSGGIGISCAGNSNFLNNYSKSTVNPITSISENKTLLNIASTSSSSANLRDRLKRKMQILLNKQYKADKKAEIERTERQVQQQQEREDEMRELALKLRRRQRELRHKYGTPTDSEDEDMPIPSTNNSPNEQEMLIALTKRSKSKSAERERSRGHHRSRSSSRGYSRRRYRSRSRDRNRSPYNRSSRASSGRSYRYRDRNNERRSRDRSRSRDYDRNDRYRSRNGNDYSQNMSKSKSKQLVDY